MSLKGNRNISVTNAIRLILLRSHDVVTKLRSNETTCSYLPWWWMWLGLWNPPKICERITYVRDKNWTVTDRNTLVENLSQFFRDYRLPDIKSAFSVSFIAFSHAYAICISTCTCQLWKLSQAKSCGCPIHLLGRNESGTRTRMETK